MEEDAKAAWEQAKLQLEETIRKRKEECAKQEERIEEIRNADTVEISEDGKILLKDNIDMDSAGSDQIKADAVKEPITYTKTGQAIPAGQEAQSFPACGSRSGVMELTVRRVEERFRRLAKNFSGRPP